MSKVNAYLLIVVIFTFNNSFSATMKILNIRGGAGTGGFTEGGYDNELCSFGDNAYYNGNHGWSQFGDTLRAHGFEITEVQEGPNKKNCDASLNLPCSDPVNFDSIGLDKFDVVIMGSNNSRYSPTAVGTLLKYVDKGGGVVFISDANFGRNWGDAANSDQSFLDSIGWIMNQDHGQYAAVRSEGTFLVPDHPILKNVNSFDGEGESPITVAKTSYNGFTSTILVRANKDVQRNTSFNAGPVDSARANDADLCIATRKQGRIVGYFDRNTFFNKLGGGTDITQRDNGILAVNLMKWVSEGRTAVSLSQKHSQKASKTLKSRNRLVKEFGFFRYQILGRSEYP